MRIDSIPAGMRRPRFVVFMRFVGYTLEGHIDVAKAVRRAGMYALAYLDVNLAPTVEVGADDLEKARTVAANLGFQEPGKGDAL